MGLWGVKAEDELRAAPLSVKASAEVCQLVIQADVVHEVGGFGLVAGGLSEA